jgi:DNA-binding transcriptional ArsR family regulator
MRDVLYLERLEQAETLLKPQRVEVLRQLAEPRSCGEVATQPDQTPQRVCYHVRRLVDAGLVNRVSERKIRGIHEGIHRASARSYWPSPRLVGTIGLCRAQGELSLDHLLNLVEEVQVDIGLSTGPRPSSLRSESPVRSGSARSNARNSWTTSRPRCWTCSPATAAPKVMPASSPSPATPRDNAVSELMKLRTRVAAPLRKSTTP